MNDHDPLATALDRGSNRKDWQAFVASMNSSDGACAAAFTDWVSETILGNTMPGDRYRLADVLRLYAPDPFLGLYEAPTAERDQLMDRGQEEAVQQAGFTSLRGTAPRFAGYFGCQEGWPRAVCLCEDRPQYERPPEPPTKASMGRWIELQPVYYRANREGGRHLPDQRKPLVLYVGQCLPCGAAYWMLPDPDGGEHQFRNDVLRHPAAEAFLATWLRQAGNESLAKKVEEMPDVVIPAGWQFINVNNDSGDTVAVRRGMQEYRVAQGSILRLTPDLQTTDFRDDVELGDWLSDGSEVRIQQLPKCVAVHYVEGRPRRHWEVGPHHKRRNVLRLFDGDRSLRFETSFSVSHLTARKMMNSKEVAQRPNEEIEHMKERWTLPWLPVKSHERHEIMETRYWQRYKPSDMVPPDPVYGESPLRNAYPAFRAMEEMRGLIR